MPRPDQTEKKPSTARSDRGKAAEIVEGESVVEDVAGAERLPFKATDHPRFILSYRPDRWDYFKQVDRILPVLGVSRIVPGINRVDAKGGIDGLLVALQKEGAVVMFDRHVKMRGQSPGYTRKYPMQGGTGYLPLWEQVRRAGKTAEIVVNWDLRLEFHDYCLRDGLHENISELALVTVYRKYVHMAKLVEVGARDGASSSLVREFNLYRKAARLCGSLAEQYDYDIGFEPDPTEVEAEATVTPKQGEG